MEYADKCNNCFVVANVERMTGSICVSCRANTIIEMFDIAAMEDMYGDNPSLFMEV